MAKGPEAAIQSWAITYAATLGVIAIRMHMGAGIRTGWPDVLFLIPGGKSLFIEFKAPGKKATKLQKKRIRELERLGYDVCVCDSKDAAREAIARAVDTALISE